MTIARKTHQELLNELEELRLRLQEAEQTLEAIRTGGIDALVVATPQGEEQLFTLEGADRVYRIFLETISQGALTLSADGLVLYANEAAKRLLSLGPSSVVGSPLRTFVRSDERRRFDALIERARTAPVHAEVGIRSRAGRVPLYLSLQPLEDRGDRMVVTVMTDLTGQKATEAALEAERLARSIFEQAGEPIIVCDRDGIVIRASRTAVALAGRQPLFEPFDAVLPLLTPDGRRFSLQGRGRSKPLRGQEVRFERADGASFALILNATPLKTTTQGLIGRVITLTDVTRLKNAEEAREKLLRDVERANLELAAIEALSFAGLSLANVEQVTHAIVSRVATTMAADQVTLRLAEQGELHLAARVPPSEAPTRATIPVGVGFAGTIAKLGRPLVVTDVKSSQLVRRHEVRRQIRSLLGVPLLSGNDLLGVLYVGWTEKREPDSGEQRFMQIVADRAATAIAAQLLTRDLQEQRLVAERAASEKATLFEEQQRIAMTLQEHFIHPLPVVAGLDLGSVSQPASQPELLGGDLSDVFLVDDRSVIVLIADVSGKGVHAAGLTETVRSTVRALALIDTSPAFILAKTNELLLRRNPDEAHVTAFCAVLDPTTGHLSYASAGHPTPVHLGPFSCRSLPATFGPPLGTWEFPYTNEHIVLTLEDSLVFFTDGVTEARCNGELFGEDRLIATVAARRGSSAQDIAEAVRDGAVGFADRLRDDIEIIALRLG